MWIMFTHLSNISPIGTDNGRWKSNNSSSRMGCSWFSIFFSDTVTVTHYSHLGGSLAALWPDILFRGRAAGHNVCVCARLAVALQSKGGDCSNNTIFIVESYPQL